VPGDFFYPVYLDKITGGKMKKMSSFLIGMMICSAAAFAGTDPGNKIQLTDILKSPAKAILAPVKGGGLVDLVLKPTDLLFAPVIDLGEVVVTPSRTSEYTYNVNKNITVISNEDIVGAKPRYLQDVLQRENNVVMDGLLNNAKDNKLDLRGFGDSANMNYLVLVDGRRTNQIDLSGPDLAQVDVNSIDRIEISRGPGTVLYGDNATGGVINIITKKHANGHQIEYSQEIGSYRYFKEYVSVSGREEFMDYYLSYSPQSSRGYRLNSSYEADDICSNMAIRPAEYLNIDLSSGFHRDWYGQSGALYDGNLQSDGREGTRFPDSKAKTEDQYFTVDPHLMGEIDDNEIVLSSLMSYRLRRASSRDVSFNIYETGHNISTYDVKPKCEINSSFMDDSLENKLVAGTDYFYAADLASSGDVAFTKSELKAEKRTFGVYASDNVMLNKRFILNGGARGEWAGYSFDQTKPVPGLNERELRDAAFDTGAGYKYNEKSQLYFDFSRSYRFPGTDEYFQSAYESFDWWTFTTRVFPSTLNSDLKQQTGNNYELGIKDHSFDYLRLNADYYLMNIRNEILLDPYTPENPVNDKNINYPRTTHHGLEFDAKIDIFEKATPFVKYTYEKAFFVGGKYASKNIPLVPENKIVSGVDLTPVDGLDLSYTVNFLGSRFAANDMTNTASKIKSHVTSDISVSYKYSSVRIFGVVRNILSEEYPTNATKNFAGNTAFYPAPGINFECGISVVF
jgi:iron complex outermembrane receptor protein